MEDARGIFGFEQSFADDLRFMPLSIRYRLDLAGLKLKLEDWLRIPMGSRERLLRMPVGGEKEVASFREEMLGIAATNGCRVPADVMPLGREAWEGKGGIPDKVREACGRIGAEAVREEWERLPDFRRYALYKLACSEREPGAFAAAHREILGG
jgi:hypothetical protein